MKARGATKQRNAGKFRSSFRSCSLYKRAADAVELLIPNITLLYTQRATTQGFPYPCDSLSNGEPCPFASTRIHSQKSVHECLIALAPIARLLVRFRTGGLRSRRDNLSSRGKIILGAFAAAILATQFVVPRAASGKRE